VEERDTRCENDRGRANSVFLKIERRAWLVKTGEFIPFCVAGDSADGTSMHWSGPNELTIDARTARMKSSSSTTANGEKPPFA
jgi:hypothetical protein